MRPTRACVVPSPQDHPSVSPDCVRSHHHGPGQVTPSWPPHCDAAAGPCGTSRRLEDRGPGGPVGWLERQPSGESIAGAGESKPRAGESRPRAGDSRPRAGDSRARASESGAGAGESTPWAPGEIARILTPGPSSRLPWALEPLDVAAENAALGIEPPALGAGASAPVSRAPKSTLNASTNHRLGTLEHRTV
jgi:hypothetical protein